MVTILSPFYGHSVLNQFVFIPFFRYITTFVLQKGAIPFVSLSNLEIILTKHPFVALALLIELAALLFVIYSQLALLILVIKNQFDLKESLSEYGQCLKHFRLGSLLLLAIYFLLIIPFANIVFRTPLFSQAKNSTVYCGLHDARLDFTDGFSCLLCRDFYFGHFAFYSLCQLWCWIKRPLERQ